MSNGKDATVMPLPNEMELRIRFLCAALASVPNGAWNAIRETLSDAQKKQPELSTAIIADRLAKAAVYVLKSEKKPEAKTTGAGDSWGS